MRRHFLQFVTHAGIFDVPKPVTAKGGHEVLQIVCRPLGFALQ